MQFGAEVQDGGVRFRLWAAKHAHVSLKIEGDEEAHLMRAEVNGWHTLTTDAAHAGARYRFVLSDGMIIPDPASRFQPLDVHGPSEVIDPYAYEWRNAGWRGRAWEEAVLYELHIGCFTPQGTFRAAIAKLDALVDLGVTGIELRAPSLAAAASICSISTRTAPLRVIGFCGAASLTTRPASGPKL